MAVFALGAARCSRFSVCRRRAAAVWHGAARRNRKNRHLHRAREHHAGRRTPGVVVAATSGGYSPGARRSAPASHDLDRAHQRRTECTRTFVFGGGKRCCPNPEIPASISAHTDAGHAAVRLRHEHVHRHHYRHLNLGDAHASSPHVSGSRACTAPAARYLSLRICPASARRTPTSNPDARRCTWTTRVHTPTSHGHEGPDPADRSDFSMCLGPAGPTMPAALWSCDVARSVYRIFIECHGRLSGLASTTVAR